MTVTQRSRTAPPGSVPGPVLNDCPQCGLPAQILAYWSFDSGDGPVEHLEIRCALSHGFIVPTSTLGAAA
jgi:hypothetical protein